MPHVFVTVPTFKEVDKIRQLLNSFISVNPPGVSVIIANGNPGDETSELIHRLESSGLSVQETSGDSSLYWSGLTNCAIRSALTRARDDDFIVLMNADVTFSSDVFAILRAKIEQLGPCILACLTTARGRVVSSGVLVFSWLWAMNRHPLAGEEVLRVEKERIEPVDFLPGRCTMIPVMAIRKAGGINEFALPHYGADYEFTRRLKHAGYPAYLFSGASVECDVANTGHNVFHKKIPLARRLRGLFSIKSADNPFYRTRFIWLAYPRYAFPTATLAYLCKSLACAILGGERIRAFAPGLETGLSGSESASTTRTSSKFE